jgi:protein-export membrane protein SecD
MTMTRENIARLIATVVVVAAVVFVSLDIDHPKWAVDLAFWQPERERDITIKYGSDLGPNVQVLLALDVPEDESPLPGAMEQVQAVLRGRAKSLTGADPTVQVVDDRHILVTVLGVLDTDVLSSTLQAEGMVEIVDAGSAPPYDLAGGHIYTSLNPPPMPEPTPESTAPITPTTATTATAPLTPTESVSPTDTVSPTDVVSPTDETAPVAETETPVDIPQVYQTIVTSYDLNAIELRDGSPNSQVNVPYHVAIWPTDQGAQALDAHAMAAPGQYLGVVLDKQGIAYNGLPQTPQLLFTTSGGPFAFLPLVVESEVDAVRAVLGSGPLPVPLKVVSVESVEPALGKETIQSAGIASIIGMAAALVLLLAHYRFPGLLAGLSLVVFGFTCFALCKVIPLAISMPSLTGFGVAILLALRAQLAILERLREEIRAHRPLKRAVQYSLDRAQPAIVRTHLALLLVAIAVSAVGLASTALPILWMGTALIAGACASGLAALVITPLLVSLASNVSQNWLDERGWLLGI